ncbi:hypothetical protein ACM614_00440 [Streptomyces sp. 12297]
MTTPDPAKPTPYAPSPALVAAVRRIGDVFAGHVSRGETGCGYCHAESDVALLRVPDVPLTRDAVSYFLHEVPSHYDDHPAVMRRLLPQVAEGLAEGWLHAWGHFLAGLGASGWRDWPADQAAALAGFLDAWWTDTLAAEQPVQDAGDVFECCVTVHSTVTPYLARWAEQPLGGPADAHLDAYLSTYIDDLIGDEPTVFGSWTDSTREEPINELRAWVRENAPARLRACGADPMLRFKTGLLDLPYEDRWTDEIWDRAPATS